MKKNNWTTEPYHFFLFKYDRAVVYLMTFFFFFFHLFGTSQITFGYGSLHSRGHAKMYACAKYHWLLDQQLLRNWLNKRVVYRSPEYHINWPFGSGECKKDFQDNDHLWFLNGTILALFIYKSPWCFLPSLESIGLSAQEKKKKIDFQDDSHGGHLGCPIRMILAILTYQSPRCFLSFQDISRPFVSEEARNRFSRRRPFWISHRNNLSYFLSTSHPDASYIPSFISTGLWFP